MSGFKGYRVLIGVALLLAAFSLFVSALLFTRLASSTTRTNRALCTFRDDVQQRVTAGERFLHQHPRGIAGIPNATLRQSLAAQRRTVAALGELKCPPPDPVRG